MPSRSGPCEWCHERRRTIVDYGETTIIVARGGELEGLYNKKYRALMRETSLAAQTLCSGLTDLRKAELGKPGVYYAAFFGLSVGFERLCKIVLVLDHVIDHDGLFPTDDKLRKIGHDVQALIEKTQEVRKKYASDNDWSPFPDDRVVDVMTRFLCGFATRTRYYNLDYLHDNTKDFEPINEWNEGVGSEIIRKHYPSERQQMHRKTSEGIGRKIDPVSSIYLSNDAEGTVITDAVSMIEAGMKIALIQEWSQFYALKIARYLAVLISNVQSYVPRKDMPDLGEILWPFYANDRRLRSLKRWSIYRS